VVPSGAIRLMVRSASNVWFNWSDTDTFRIACVSPLTARLASTVVLSGIPRAGVSLKATAAVPAWVTVSVVPEGTVTVPLRAGPLFARMVTRYAPLPTPTPFVTWTHGTLLNACQAQAPELAVTPIVPVPPMAPG